MDEKFYEAVMNELQAGNLRKGLWAKANVEFPAHPQGAYLRMRAEQLYREACQRYRESEKRRRAKSYDRFFELLAYVAAAVIGTPMLVGLIAALADLTL